MCFKDAYINFKIGRIPFNIVKNTCYFRITLVLRSANGADTV